MISHGLQICVDGILHAILLCWLILILTLDGGVIFVDKEKLNDELIANFEENHIEIKDYNDIYEYVKTFDSDAVIMLDSSVVNYAITQNLNQNIKIEDRVNPSQLMKAYEE